jgi:hypothetical protein
LGPQFFHLSGRLKEFGGQLEVAFFYQSFLSQMGSIVKLKLFCPADLDRGGGLWLPRRLLIGFQI